MTKDGTIWMNQNQLAELFATSIPNISMHIAKILKDIQLHTNSVVKYYFTTAADGNFNISSIYIIKISHSEKSHSQNAKSQLKLLIFT
jgi:hypothetical protein